MHLVSRFVRRALALAACLVVVVLTLPPVSPAGQPDASPRAGETRRLAVPVGELTELATRRPPATVPTTTTSSTTTTSRPPAVVPGPGDASAVASGDVSSTAYCLTGTMANGQPARRGAVAANAWPLGTRLRVTPSPVGEIVTVEDRIGHGSQLDFALPGDCAAARSWGRRAVTVEVLEA